MKRDEAKVRGTLVAELHELIALLEDPTVELLDYSGEKSRGTADVSKPWDVFRSEVFNGEHRVTLSVSLYNPAWDMRPGGKSFVSRHDR